VPVVAVATGSVSEPVDQHWSQVYFSVRPITPNGTGLAVQGDSFRVLQAISLAPNTLYAVTIEAFAQEFSNTGGFALLTGKVTATVDPYFYFDSNFAATGYSLVFSNGVGNSPVEGAPGPIVGAGLPGIILACGGFLIWRRRWERAA